MASSGSIIIISFSYRITAVVKVETDIITTSLKRQAGILVIMYVKTVKMTLLLLLVTSCV